jgi:uncharacterized membrane protein YgaE (UPF0421/DUF939 family)
MFKERGEMMTAKNNKSHDTKNEDDVRHTKTMRRRRRSNGILRKMLRVV